MIHLLTLGLRVMTILEFLVRRSLAEQEDELSGIYAGNPKRKTAKPTATLLLLAFTNIYLQTIILDGQVVHQHITPLNSVQLRILQLLNLPPTLYQNLTNSDYSLPLPNLKPAKLDSS
jgi:transposase